MTRNILEAVNNAREFFGIEDYPGDWQNPKVNEIVLQFITDLTCSSAETEEQYEIIRFTFKAGYCWHFAHILKNTFKRGEVCWAAPFGHIVWVDVNGVPYDAEGLNEGEQMYNIPESYLGDFIKDFIHIPGEEIPVITKDDIVGAIRKYEDDNNLPHQRVVMYDYQKGGYHESF